MDVSAKFLRKFTAESGNEYTIKLLFPDRGIPLGLKLTKVVLPIIGGAVDGMRHDEDLYGPPKTFSDIAQRLVTSMDQIDLMDLIKDLLKGATIKEPDCNNRDLDFNTDFVGNYGELIEVLEFSLKENFGSLFKAKGIGRRLTETVTEVLDPTGQE